jgi:hypothetical protein
MASDFSPYLAFREVLGYELSNGLGSSQTVEVFTAGANAQGRDSSTFAAGTTETVHVKTMTADLIRLWEGFFNAEDLVITAPSTTAITIESRITIGSNKYIVQREDDSRMEGNVVFKRFFCKKQNSS